MSDTRWKVGALARLTGVSVRTLHFYDEIGLLCPSQRSESGYRLYSQCDIVRLGQIRSLRHIGFSLQEVQNCLAHADSSPQQIIALHLARLNEQIESQQQLQIRLAKAQAQLQNRKSVSVEDFLKIIEAMTMTEKYFSPEQLAELENRRQAVGEDRIHEVEAEWPRLMDEVREAIARDDDPAGEAGQKLAQRWNALIEEFTGGNPEIRQSLNSMYENESNVAGMDVEAMRDLAGFIARANAAAVR